MIKEWIMDMNFTVAPRKRRNTIARMSEPFFRFPFMTWPSPGIINAEQIGERMVFFILMKGFYTNLA